MTEEAPTEKKLPPPPPRLDSARHPFEQFVLFLGTAAGLPLMLGVAPQPGTTSAILGDILVRLWAALLFGGCATAWLGSWWDKTACLGRWWHRWKPRPTSSLLIERVGLIALGGSCVVYVYGIIAAGGASSRLVTVALIIGLGLAALYRSRQISKWVSWTVAAKELVDGTG